jgi:hypothetical protein
MSYIVSSEWDQPNETNNYFVRHWRGSLSLPVSYWVNGVVLAGVVSFSTLSLVRMAESSGLSLQALAAIYLVYLVCAGVLWLWSMVGIWRSAGFHEERGGAPGWATVAKIVVILGLLGAIGQSRNTALAASEYTRLAMGDDPMGHPASMTIDPEHKALVVDGALSLGTADKFNALLGKKKDVRRVVLQSVGGRTREAQRMAETIAQRGLDTEVKQTCLSACTLVLLAGRERSATAYARVGFHQPTFPGLTPEEQRAATNDLRRMYEKAGVTSAFLDSALSASPDSMWYPSHGELIDGNVLNTTNVIVSKKALEARHAQLARYLKYSADQINSKGRIRLDSLTTRTGATASDRVLTIRLQIEAPKETLNIAEGRPKVYETVKQESCSDRATRQAIRAGATIIYSYRDLNGRSIFDLKVDDCDS